MLSWFAFVRLSCKGMTENDLYRSLIVNQLIGGKCPLNRTRFEISRVQDLDHLAH
jgi:hypothetical protein